MKLFSTLISVLFKRSLPTINMRFFTGLFKKVNISVYGNAVTVYPKPTGEIRLAEKSFSLFDAKKTIIRKKMLHSEIFKASNDLEALGAKWVKSEQIDHKVLHKDGFPQNKIHCHAIFPWPMNAERIIKISDIFVKHNVLLTEEKELFLQMYNDASAIPHDDAEKLISIEQSIRNSFSRP